MLEAMKKITAEPASILAISGGDLSLNANADIAIFNPNLEWKVSARELKSKGKNTPFIGLEMQGRVKYTLLNGQISQQH
jgi:dihydroorotase